MRLLHSIYAPCDHNEGAIDMQRCVEGRHIEAAPVMRSICEEREDPPQAIDHVSQRDCGQMFPGNQIVTNGDE